LRQRNNAAQRSPKNIDRDIDMQRMTTVAVAAMLLSAQAWA
jgi:hypothetical protein